MHAGRRERKREAGARLEMTPMIDVVFLLLVFFVVTVQPKELLAKLEVSRPAAPTQSPQMTLLRIHLIQDLHM